MEVLFMVSGGDHRSMTFKQKCHDGTFVRRDHLSESAKMLEISRSTMARSVRYSNAIENYPELNGLKLGWVLALIKEYRSSIDKNFKPNVRDERFLDFCDKIFKRLLET